MKLLLALSVLLTACASHSKPTRAPNKVTPGEAPSSLVEVEANVVYAPRRPTEVEQALIFQPPVQECLRQGFLDQEIPFSLLMTGKIEYTGEWVQVKTESPSVSLKACMDAALPAVRMGRGQSGYFKIEVKRGWTPGRRKKGLLLDLNPPDAVKKFE